MAPLLLGAIIGGLVMWRWRREIETYVGRLFGARQADNMQGQRALPRKAPERAPGDAPESAQGGIMNAIALLKEQHEDAQRGFRGIEQARQEERGTVWAALRPKLKLHEQLEEAHVYGPAAHDSGANDRLASWPARHQQEVREAERLMETIDGQPAGEDEWMRSVQGLRAALERHIQEEENDIWPAITRIWDQRRLEEAGAAIQKAQSEARAQ